MWLFMIELSGCEVLKLKNLHISALLDVYGEFLSEKQKRIAENYYYDDLSLSEIAENENITRQGVSDLIKRAEAQLLSYEAKCHYSENISKLKKMRTDIANGSFDTKQLIEIIDDL